jgi:hypothetical protein
MKKTILLLSISLLAVASVIAQNKPRFIFTPGLSLAKASFEPSGDADIKSKIGFDGGVGVEFGISKYLAIQPEVNYSMQGLEAEGDGSKTVIKLDYITIPVLAKIKPTTGLSILVGPQIGFLTSAKAEITGQDDQDLKALLKSTDFFGVFGAEYQFTNGFFVGARYQLGFADIVDAENASAEIKNRALTFRVGYSFPFGGTGKKK